MNTLGSWATTAAIAALAGAVQAAPVFQGRLADGTASNTCTASGVSKCAMFYNTTLDITILNDWNIGASVWGSAQALGASAGAAQTDFTGWGLPSGDGSQAAGALNEYLSIWNDVGGSLAGLLGQFDGVRAGAYWSDTEFDAVLAWGFGSGDGSQFGGSKVKPASFVAVRPGDVAAFVPEPQTLALVLLALGATVVVRRRQPV